MQFLLLVLLCCTGPQESMEPRLTPLLGLACPDKAFCGGPEVGHHSTESQSFLWWTCGRPPSNGEPKLSVVDLWSATIQRIASLSKGVKVWGKASQSCCGGPVVSHHPTDSLTQQRSQGLGQGKPKLLWWTCGQPPSNRKPHSAKESRSGARQAKAAVVDLWSATIQRIASLSKGVKVWGKASQSCCGGPVVSHHPTDSLTQQRSQGLGQGKPK